MKRRSRRKKRAGHDRSLALAYLGAVSTEEVYLKRIVDEHIERVLGATDHNLSIAAELLGINRRSLQRHARRKRAGARPRAKR